MFGRVGGVRRSRDGRWGFLFLRVAFFFVFGDFVFFVFRVRFVFFIRIEFFLVIF